jgi:putative redox protein
LASCTAITLRMYANRNQWPVNEIKVEVGFQRDKENNTTQFIRNINISGNLTEPQTAKLLSIANACPVHKLLTNGINIQSNIQKV